MKPYVIISYVNYTKSLFGILQLILFNAIKVNGLLINLLNIIARGQFINKVYNSPWHC